MGAYAGPDIVENGLVLCLDAGNRKSYPSPFTGNTWTDLSGNGNNGTLNNGVGYNSANGGSLIFDGIDDFVSVPNSNSINITTNTITFGGWVYPTIGSGKYQLLLVKSTGGPRQYGMFLSSLGTTKIYRVLDPIVGQGDVTLSSPWTVNAWNYILLVYNGSTLKIYLNGSEVFSEGASGNITSTTHPVHIGGEASQPYKLVGRISQALIYNRALTAGEITQNFNATRSRFGI